MERGSLFHRKCEKLPVCVHTRGPPRSTSGTQKFTKGQRKTQNTPFFITAQGAHNWGFIMYINPFQMVYLRKEKRESEAATIYQVRKHGHQNVVQRHDMQEGFLSLLARSRYSVLEGALDVLIQATDLFPVFFEHDVNNITDGDHTGHGTRLNNRNVAEVLLNHEFHNIQDAVLWGYSDQIGRRGHDFMNFGVGGLPAFHNDLGEVICDKV